MTHHPRFSTTDLEPLHRDQARADAALRRHGIGLVIFLAAAIAAVGAAHLAAWAGLTLQVTR